MIETGRNRNRGKKEEEQREREMEREIGWRKEVREKVRPHLAIPNYYAQQNEEHNSKKNMPCPWYAMVMLYLILHNSMLCSAMRCYAILHINIIE